LDGSGKCDHCAAVTRIQPSQARGGETPAELAAFLRADSGARAGASAAKELAASAAAARAATEDGPPALRASFSYPFAPSPRPRTPMASGDTATEEILIEFLREDR
jgi:hypothetical protein